MAAKPLDFNLFAQEANRFFKELGENLNHPKDEDHGQVVRALRAVLHVLRDHITISQSLHLLSQLPMFLKAVYVEQWHYQEKPQRVKSLEEFKDKIKEKQRELGEVEFNWDEHTEEIMKRVLATLGQYLNTEVLDHVSAELPEEIRNYIRKEVIPVASSTGH